MNVRTGTRQRSFISGNTKSDFRYSVGIVACRLSCREGRVVALSRVQGAVLTPGERHCGGGGG